MTVCRSRDAACRLSGHGRKRVFIVSAMKTRTENGFTLYELLTTMLIVGVVLAMGVPNMQSFRQNSRMTAAANDLHSSFHLARSEASRAKTSITICASANSMDAVPVCGGELEAGWIVFEDTDGDIVADAGEFIIRRYPAVAASIVVNTTGPDDYFSFASTGLGRGNVNGTPPLATMVLCDDRGNIRGGGGKSTARVLVVTPLGRATVLADEGQITFHGGC
jgi:type IV fimbrial biogenesis protein FimT